jgi:hypothetical protein
MYKKDAHAFRTMLINFMVGELQVEQYLTCINILQLMKFPFELLRFTNQANGQSVM